MATAKKAPAKKIEPIKADAPAKKVPKSESKVEYAPRKINAAFMKPLTPSAELAVIVGKTPLPRTEVVKKLWEHIKANKLQDPKDKRQIIADAKLKPIFGKDQVSMFEMTALVSKHLK